MVETADVLKEIEECEKVGGNFAYAAELAHRYNLTSIAKKLYLKASERWAQKNEFELAIYMAQMSEVTEMSIADADKWVRNHKPTGRAKELCIEAIEFYEKKENCEDKIKQLKSLADLV